MQSIQPNGPFSRPRSTEIPTGYQTSVLRALPCNPTQLFVYWELPQSTESCTSISLTLIESNTTREADTPPVLELTVSPVTSSCYLTIPVPGTSYKVQLDATYSGGKHLVLHSEKPVDLPSPAPAPDTPVRGHTTPEPSTPAELTFDSTSVEASDQSEESSVPNSLSSWLLQKHIKR